jgi:uncharacterized protein (TIGR03067 family)
MTPMLLALSLTLAAPAPKEVPKKEAPTVVGNWVPESLVMSGTPEKLDAGMSFTLTADGKCLVKEGAGDPDEMLYNIDPKKDPGHFDLREPGMQGELMKGIYKLDGDTLTICLSMKGDRPDKFESPAGSMNLLVTLKRVKKD